MDKIIKNILLIFALFVLSTNITMAAVRTFVATLDGPTAGTTSPATGTVTVEFDSDANTIRYIVSYSGLAGINTGARINGPTAVANTGTASSIGPIPSIHGWGTGTVSGSVDHTDDSETASSYSPAYWSSKGSDGPTAEAAYLNCLIDNKCYLNISSVVHPSGEIKGFFAEQVASTGGPASTNFKLQSFSFGNAGGGGGTSPSYGIMANLGEMVGKTNSADASWYDAGWNYRLKITIDHTKVASDQTDFPVYLNLADLSADFHNNVNQTDARDIRVTKADGVTELPREVVFYDSNTDTGELHFKFNGTLSSTVDTDVYIYYGNTSTADYAVTDTYGGNNVWESNYKAVYHLSSSSGTTAYDSTTQGYDSSSFNGSPTWTNSTKVGRGILLEAASNQWINVNDNNDFDAATNNFTACMWINPNTTGPQYAESLGHRINSGTNLGWEFRWSAANQMQFLMDFGASTQSVTSSTMSTGTWYYLCSSVDRAGNITMYVDGSSLTPATISAYSGLDISNTDSLRIGDYAGSSTYDFDGIIDEVTFSDTNRSAEWVTTTYNNQNSSSTFFSVFGNQEVPASGLYGIGFGLAYVMQSIVPEAPTFVNDGNYYNKLHLTLSNLVTVPNDTKYAVAISSDNWATTKYVKSDMTVGGTLAMTDYMTYPVWGGASGVYIIGLDVGTTYRVKVKSMQGQYTESGYGIEAVAGTVSPILTFDIDVATSDISTDPPYLIDFGDLYSGVITESTKKVWISFETNASSGGSVFVYGQNGGLKSLSAGYTIPAISGNLNLVSNGFGAQGVGSTQSSGGPLTIDALYGGGGDIVGVTDTLVRQLLLSTNPVVTGRASFVVKAKSDNNVPSASDYTETITVIAAANY